MKTKYTLHFVDDNENSATFSFVRSSYSHDTAGVWRAPFTSEDDIFAIVESWVQGEGPIGVLWYEYDGAIKIECEFVQGNNS